MFFSQEFGSAFFDCQLRHAKTPVLEIRKLKGCVTNFIETSVSKESSRNPFLREVI